MKEIWDVGLIEKWEEGFDKDIARGVNLLHGPKKITNQQVLLLICPVAMLQHFLDLP